MPRIGRPGGESREATSAKEALEAAHRRGLAKSSGRRWTSPGRWLCAHEEEVRECSVGCRSGDMKTKYAQRCAEEETAQNRAESRRRGGRTEMHEGGNYAE